MNPTVDCPHNLVAAVRSCRGCACIDDGSGMVACEGEASGKVYSDSEGDAGVINGIHNFLAVEDLESSCGCTLSPAEEQAVTDKLCEDYAEDDGLADMYEDDARREAGF